MRLLFDARSVRTPAGRYVFQGLVRGWLADPRVSRVIVALPETGPHELVPEGAITASLSRRSWRSHLQTELPRLAHATRADIVFSPNATPPRHPGAVFYFQDVTHFHRSIAGARVHAMEILRTIWRRSVASHGLLAVAVSEYIARYAASSVPVPCVVIPNGVDVGQVRWTGGRDVVLVVGGTGKRKNEGMAVAAWARLTPSIRGSTRLHIVGVEPMHRRIELASIAQRLGVEKSVSIQGSIDRDALLQCIADCRIAISCTTFESFGLPAAEALAIGAPVLCSAIPAHIELIARAGAGEAFPARDDVALAERLVRFFQGYAPRRLETSPIGWDWATRAREHVDAYESRLLDAAPWKEIDADPRTEEGRMNVRH